LEKVFDPNFHEAVAQAPAPGKADQEIVTGCQRGYLLNGRLLRAPKQKKVVILGLMVIVSKCFYPRFYHGAEIVG
jgi:hypothetical protein